MNQRALDALASAIYVSKLSLAGAAITEDDQKIRASGLYKDWAAGNHTVGEIYNAASQTWECYAAYDNQVYPDIVPGSTAWTTFNRPLHGKTPETARPFVPVEGAHDVYRAGEYMVWEDGLIYPCLRDTSFGPTDDPTAWGTPIGEEATEV